MMPKTGSRAILWALGGREVRKPPGTDHMGLFGEFWLYLRHRKKWWITPIFVVLIGLSGFILWAESSAVLPFIYALF